MTSFAKGEAYNSESKKQGRDSPSSPKAKKGRLALFAFPSEKRRPKVQALEAGQGAKSETFAFFAFGEEAKKRSLKHNHNKAKPKGY